MGSEIYDVVVIGGGPGGLSAAQAASEEGASVLIIEREERLGGILKQCIHDGFGLIRFGEKLSGPEYSERYIDFVKEHPIDVETSTFVLSIKKEDEIYSISAVNTEGIHEYKSKTIVLATGCRERTAKQVFIHGTRPSGVFTAGSAQYFTNILGEKIAKRCVILGSGDIGLIMARRLTLEGSEVVGVYEVKPVPSGLTRNIVQCLDDYGIPLHLSHTVTKVFGDERVEGVEVQKVDENLKPIEGTEEYIPCDALILSVGLIPENEIAERLSVKIDPRTKGPVCDTDFMTSVDGVFSCGNAMHVNDLVDYVSEGGARAGRAAARFSRKEVNDRHSVEIVTRGKFAYLTPQRLSLESRKNAIFYFRAGEEIKEAELIVLCDEKEIYRKKFNNLKPPEMEKLEIDFSKFEIEPNSKLEISLEVMKS